MRQYNKSLFLLATMFTAMLISGCAGSTDAADTSQDKLNSANRGTADNTSEVLSVEALEEFLEKNHESGLLKVIAKGSFAGDRHLNLEATSGKSGSFSITYTCKQNKPSNMSIWLKADKSDHTSQMRRLMETEGCRPGSIETVSLPISEFPQANQVLFIAEPDTKITTLIHEAKLD
ncbi:hypothetical protein [Mobiluncus mulieris]|uniref:Lipoprotein n=2 Tax=Mobiluncus mulieris TaxID=2052 RepID=A0ABD4TVV3_9ACTO|nr:hypothetical protein [Mobiluncus mulieris]MCU9969024.1 hypothetical protein [Mobiluncus mulieris]MCU9973713.1 hypothetical protein [Mobiluncus mulieris]NMW75078.1 hypothetical protein [Mobiluncus mulieris]NMX11640.1 hypothetical protein [Mobiluncus mulieris]